jgi:hypothetical protein
MDTCDVTGHFFLVHNFHMGSIYMQEMDSTTIHNNIYQGTLDGTLDITITCHEPPDTPLLHQAETWMK